MPNLSWDDYFMSQAVIASCRSKDPNTKVGCVIVDKNNHQVSMGYNGMVAGIDESKTPWGRNGSFVDTKYAYVVHSEANAILHAKSSLENCRLYVTMFPCNECAKMICSVGIAEVVYINDKYSEQESTIVAKKLFDLKGILCRQLPFSKTNLIQMIENLTDLPT